MITLIDRRSPILIVDRLDRSLTPSICDHILNRDQPIYSRSWYLDNRSWYRNNRSWYLDIRSQIAQLNSQTILLDDQSLFSINPPVDTSSFLISLHHIYVLPILVNRIFVEFSVLSHKQDGKILYNYLRYCIKKVVDRNIKELTVS